MIDNLKFLSKNYKSSETNDKEGIFCIWDLVFVVFLVIIYFLSIFYYKNLVLKNLLDYLLIATFLYVISIAILKKYIKRHLIFKIIFWKVRFITLFFLIIGIGLLYLFLIKFGDNYDNMLMAWITLYGIIIAVTEVTYNVKESNKITQKILM